MSSSPEDNNKNLLNIVKELTFKLESTSRFEKQFRKQVRDKINNFIPPIRQASNYISMLKEKIKNLEEQLEDLENDLDGENAETIRKAREKLNEFTSYIENTSELDSSLNNLGNAIDDLQKLSGEKMKKEGGGRRKLRKTRKIQKKRKAKRSNKIKYH